MNQRADTWYELKEESHGMKELKCRQTEGQSDCSPLGASFNSSSLFFFPTEKKGTRQGTERGRGGGAGDRGSEWNTKKGKLAFSVRGTQNEENRKTDVL
mmetsp:Transcript_12649/g.24625  ORF Transcript_12649/g.24625 Transcript_12649/m.24625 type:complete len:99 (+) Transcript_12649:303-599(+)